jgi:methyltransferase (TIGR00027 family)
MIENCPSQTALRVAVRRAAHQVLDNPLVFEDPLALTMIGMQGLSRDQYPPALLEETPYARVLRASMVARSRFAEDELRLAVQRGVRQYVLLGAGLDTFAYRHRYPADALRVFEVDHPDTQAWKRARLEEAGIPVPATLTFAAIDFETQTLAAGLRAAGLDTDERAYFSWLGVTPYLTSAAITETLQFVASLPAGSGIAFDYMISADLLNDAERQALAALARRVAQAGEPFQSFFAPPSLKSCLRAMGFSHVEDVGPKEMDERYFSGHAGTLRVGRLAHVMNART